MAKNNAELVTNKDMLALAVTSLDKQYKAGRTVTFRSMIDNMYFRFDNEARIVTLEIGTPQPAPHDVLVEDVYADFALTTTVTNLKFRSYLDATGVKIYELSMLSSPVTIGVYITQPTMNAQIDLVWQNDPTAIYNIPVYCYQSLSDGTINIVSFTWTDTSGIIVSNSTVSPQFVGINRNISTGAGLYPITLTSDTIDGFTGTTTFTINLYYNTWAGTVTNYVLDDRVVYDGINYVCISDITANTSNLSPDLDPTHWSVL